MDARPQPPGTVGTSQCSGVVGLDSLRDFGGLGIIRPLKMLPILLLEIFYKVLWLILVAYPLWSQGKLAGSPAEDITSGFLWVILPIVAVPWSYVFVNYVYGPRK